MKQLVLTGASGFVGRYFHLKYSTKYNINTFSFSHQTLNNFNMKDVDIVIHLSALVHQMQGADDDAYTSINVTQTLALAEYAKVNGVKHFIFLSSVKVYGEESDMVYTEESTCVPIDGYGKSKLQAEQGLKALADSGFKVSIIRSPIVYGYGVKANLKNLISLVRKSIVLPFGNIQNRRSMVYIGNLAHLIDQVITKEKEGVFLAADDKAMSTTELIKLIANALDKKIYLIRLPFFEYLLAMLKPSLGLRLFKSLEVNNTKTKAILELENPFSVEEGIKYMIHNEVLIKSIEH